MLPMLGFDVKRAEALDALFDTFDADAGGGVSLFDYTTIVLRPWLARGYECHAYDLRHPPGHTTTADGMHLWGRQVHHWATPWLAFHVAKRDIPSPMSLLTEAPPATASP